MGDFEFIDAPDGSTSTSFNSINNEGHAVGYYLGRGNMGFEYMDGQFSPIADPLGAVGTIPNGINNNDVIAGFFTKKTAYHLASSTIMDRSQR